MEIEKFAEIDKDPFLNFFLMKPFNFSFFWW